MKWHITNEEQQKIQMGDEKFFEKLLLENDFTFEKLDVNGSHKNPDYRICTNNFEVIVELKSRFENQQYNMIGSLFTDKLDKLPFGYDFSLQHNYPKVPDGKSINEKVKRVAEELEGLSENVDLPYLLKSGAPQRLYLPSNEFKIDPLKSSFNESEIKNGFEISDDFNLKITLKRKNTKKHLNCCMLISNNEDNNLLTENKRYLSRSINQAKTQFSSFLNSNVIGIIFLSHTPYGWDQYDILSLYGDLKVAFSRDPEVNEAERILGENRLIREDKKQWLSFIGLIQTGITDEILIYRNDFAEKKLQNGIFCSPKFTVKTVRLSDDNSGLIVI